MSDDDGEPGLTNFDRRELAELLRVGHARLLPASTVLWQDGQPVSHCYVVTRGTVEVSKTIDGTYHALAQRGPGSVLGLMAMLDGGACRVGVRAAEDAEVVEIGRDAIFSIFRKCFRTGDDTRASLAHKLTIMTIRRLRMATDELAQAIHRSCTTATASERLGHLRIPELAAIHAGNHAWNAAA